MALSDRPDAPPKPPPSATARLVVISVSWLFTLAFAAMTVYVIADEGAGGFDISVIAALIILGLLAAGLFGALGSRSVDLPQVDTSSEPDRVAVRQIDPEA